MDEQIPKINETSQQPPSQPPPEQQAVQAPRQEEPQTPIGFSHAQQPQPQTEQQTTIEERITRLEKAVSQIAQLLTKPPTPPQEKTDTQQILNQIASIAPAIPSIMETVKSLKSKPPASPFDPENIKNSIETLAALKKINEFLTPPPSLFDRSIAKVAEGMLITAVEEKFKVKIPKRETKTHFFIPKHEDERETDLEIRHEEEDE